MGKKVESYAADDGKLFPTEREMTVYEMEQAIKKDFPELRGSIQYIVAHADKLAKIFQPLLALQPKDHPTLRANTTRTHLVCDRGKCIICRRARCSKGCPNESERHPEGTSVRLAHG